MTKADLVEQVTASIARTAGPMISKKDCARVVDAFLEAVKEALKQQHNIEVRGFGTFKIRRRKTRMARNPRTGDPVEVAARPVPVFKPSKELRALVADEGGARAGTGRLTEIPEVDGIPADGNPQITSGPLGNNSSRVARSVIDVCSSGFPPVVLGDKFRYAC